MQKHDNGSVMLSKKEFAELNGAYQKLYDILAQFPTSLSDFCSSHAEYLKIEKWQCQLEGNNFVKANYE